jgi:hypothetical protein
VTDPGSWKYFVHVGSSSGTGDTWIDPGCSNTPFEAFPMGPGDGGSTEAETDAITVACTPNLIAEFSEPATWARDEYGNRIQTRSVLLYAGMRRGVC